MLIHGSARIMEIDLETQKCSVTEREDLVEKLGGSGLATALYREHGLPGEDALHPGQPLILAIGPLTGLFPLMSKVVLGFKSPYSGHYAETHAGGRLALALRYANLDAVVIKGKAVNPVYLMLGDREFACKDARHLWGMDTTMTARTIRNSEPAGRGKRSIIRIGPAGENLVNYACINVDTFRHFGRLGAGAVMGGKHLKALMVIGDGSFALPGSDYKTLYEDIYRQVTGSTAMKKYHDLGTSVNVLNLQGLQSLPTRNLQSTAFEESERISGEYFAEKLLLRQIACSGCPVGCIHIGLLREKFGEEHEYSYKQVSYDHEPIFAAGSMLGIAPGEDVMVLLEQAEKCGVDIISSGVALAWATEAYQKGLIGTEETLIPLDFGNTEAYRQAIVHLSSRSNDFYHLLGQGTMPAARHYGGEDFACVLGQEMAGYATGPIFFVSQALGFRVSHLDTAGYQLDQEKEIPPVEQAIKELIEEEKQRFLLTSMVACLFSRKIYSNEVVAKALESTGLSRLAGDLDSRLTTLTRERWQLKKETGFQPSQVTLPRRFYQVETIRGPIPSDYMDRLLREYAAIIEQM